MTEGTCGVEWDLMSDCDAPQLREERLYAQLAGCPAIELTGRVDGDGLWASKSRDRRHWTLVATFDAWRVGSGKIRADPLTLRRRVSHRELRGLRRAIRAFAVVKVRARVSEKSRFGPQALLEEVCEPYAADMEVRYYGPGMGDAVPYLEDDRLGVLLFGHGRYAGEVEWAGRPVHVEVNRDRSGSPASALEACHQLWDCQGSWNRRAWRYAIPRLLPVKNASWLEEGEEPADVWEFRRRTRLDSISIYGDRHFRFVFDDGDLFWGHFFELCGSVAGGFYEAFVQG